MPKKLSYKAAGVDISNAEDTKRAMAESLKTGNPLVLNSLGAFASLVDGSFPDYEHPVLVCKTEEPGSKQLLAFENNRIESICADMIHHLINDIIVMGANPLFIQDVIICGKIEKDIVKRIVVGIAKACKEQGCVLTGGETSEQPGVLAPGTYVLGASGIGVVEKTKIIDGSTIDEGDIVLALPSNGLHTNGYTLVRALMKEQPEIVKEKIGGETFIDAILKPHLCYYRVLKPLFGNPALHGLAHVTGGGIAGNLHRILPAHLDAEIDASEMRILPIFKLIRQRGNIDDADMLQAYNLGVGITAVVKREGAAEIITMLKQNGCEAYEIGRIVKGRKNARIEGQLKL